MKKITLYTTVLFCALLVQTVSSQESKKVKSKIEVLEELKTKITEQEKNALKIEVEGINERLEDGQISPDEAKTLKETAAKKRALNIENRLAIVNNKIELLQRNGNELVELESDDVSKIEIDFGSNDGEEKLFGIKWVNKERKYDIKYDRRTYSDLVIAVGLNNAIIEGQSLEDTPYKVGGSRFFEMGWQWRTRVFKNSNFMRFNYGFSFQFNGLKPKGNQYFVAAENGQTELQEFEFDLRKSKLRMDNLVFPVHFEFGPSKLRKTENKIRYSLKDNFRIGVGGYGGFNLGTRQKLKYDRNGDNVKDKLKRGYNTSDFVYGLSAYVGYDGVLLYAKYDLNPIFRDAVVEQRNISLGLRFDL
ncbi:porin family protein [Costertonia aggregata]|uniref:PorT family protein n=1 Tax=Costertonia aggregata TaxID=343403 RepID=A0A7H9ALU2_9FLAO|nr:hypothetical protein [Costertonia aggregata]QLG44418.1 hypothetical protein HYG79_03340 [Costertonia aggregata]